MVVPGFGIFSCVRISCCRNAISSISQHSRPMAPGKSPIVSASGYSLQIWSTFDSSAWPNANLHQYHPCQYSMTWSNPCVSSMNCTTHSFHAGVMAHAAKFYKSIIISIILGIAKDPLRINFLPRSSTMFWYSVFLRASWILFARRK